MASYLPFKRDVNLICKKRYGLYKNNNNKSSEIINEVILALYTQVTTHLHSLTCSKKM